MKSLSAKIVSGVIWSAAETWGRQLAVFLVFVFLAHYLGPAALGLAALAMSAPNLVSIMLQQGIPDALVQREKIDPVHFHSAFWLTVLTGALFSLAIFLLAAPLARAFGEPELEPLIRWTSVIVVIRAADIVPHAWLKRNMDYRLFAVRALASTFVAGSIGIGMAIAGYGVWSMIGFQLAGAISGTAFLLIGCGWLPKLQFQYARVRELLAFGLPITGSSVIYMLTEELPKVALGLFVGPTAVGIYTMARRIMEFFTEIYVRPLMNVVVPAVARMRNEPEKIGRFYRQVAIVGSLISFSACFGFAAIAPEAVPLVFGEKWSVAVPSLQVIMLLGAQNIIYNLSVYTLISIGKTMLIMQITAVYLVVLGALLPFVAPHGPEAIIMMAVVLNLAMIPALLFYLNKYCQLSPRKAFDQLPRIIIAALVMAVAVWLLRSALVASQLPSALVVGVSVAVGAILYSALIYVMLAGEISTVREMLARLRNKGSQPEEKAHDPASEASTSA